MEVVRVLEELRVMCWQRRLVPTERFWCVGQSEVHAPGGSCSKLCIPLTHWLRPEREESDVGIVAEGVLRGVLESPFVYMRLCQEH